ncbi:hypothetical protein HELRODRAFT_171679 [Helobdella robusta]|uniref:Uncharacterized protein n=1 Tax=Helobdella robusta TaxID=6412 RepID=T1F4J5_HELRO|nr:hypothetical protein HELRODRAFT_171679 [Helobdella robusta]ESO05311.1 hypothetical protein HELRODRAFT_171679 [Helobdella robusta]
MAVIYSRGPPFQKHFMFNYAFVINLIIVITASYLMIMYSNPWWSTLMKFKMPPSYEYRGVIVGITTFHFILCYLFEKHVIGEYVETIVQPWLSKLCLKTATKYEIIERELSVNEEWPRVTRMDIDHFMDREVDVEPDTESEQPINSLNEKRQECPPEVNDHAKKVFLPNPTLKMFLVEILYPPQQNPISTF